MGYFVCIQLYSILYMSIPRKSIYISSCQSISLIQPAQKNTIPLDFLVLSRSSFSLSSTNSLSYHPNHPTPAFSPQALLNISSSNSFIPPYVNNIALLVTVKQHSRFRPNANLQFSLMLPKAIRWDICFH
jgi:hypothetical protein